MPYQQGGTQPLRQKIAGFASVQTALGPGAPERSWIPFSGSIPTGTFVTKLANGTVMEAVNNTGSIYGISTGGSDIDSTTTGPYSGARWVPLPGTDLADDNVTPDHSVDVLTDEEEFTISCIRPTTLADVNDTGDAYLSGGRWYFNPDTSTGSALYCKRLVDPPASVTASGYLGSGGPNGGQRVVCKVVRNAQQIT